MLPSGLLFCFDSHNLFHGRLVVTPKDYNIAIEAQMQPAYRQELISSAPYSHSISMQRKDNLLSAKLL